MAKKSFPEVRLERQIIYMSENISSCVKLLDLRKLCNDIEDAYIEIDHDCYGDELYLRWSTIESDDQMAKRIESETKVRKMFLEDELKLRKKKLQEKKIKADQEYDEYLRLKEKYESKQRLWWIQPQ